MNRKLIIPVLILALLLQAHSIYAAHDNCLRPLAVYQRSDGSDDSDDEDAYLWREAEIRASLDSETGIRGLLASFDSGEYGAREWFFVIRCFREALSEDQSNIGDRFVSNLSAFISSFEKTTGQLIKEGDLGKELVLVLNEQFGGLLLILKEQGKEIEQTTKQIKKLVAAIKKLKKMMELPELPAVSMETAKIQAQVLAQI